MYKGPHLADYCLQYQLRFYNAQKLLNLGVSEHHVRTAGTFVSSGILVS